MPKKKTTEEFIIQCIELNGDRYDYSLVEYINNRTNVKIICKEHGIFEQQPLCHINGAKSGCPICAKNKKLTTEEFINRAIKIHGDKYDYSLINYIDMKTKVKIICKKHGIFEQLPSIHILSTKSGCPKCFHENRHICLDDFISRSIIFHGDKYNYSLVKMKTLIDKVKIICPIHGLFKQKPCIHLLGNGCPKCKLDNRRLSNEEFIKRSIKLHGNKYDYSLVSFNTIHDKVKIICPIHGIFEQNAQSHTIGRGCNRCSNFSKGENDISKLLDNNNIKYETQKMFDGCKNKLPLPFDFYLPDYNMCVEFDGIQHYEPVKHFGGEKRFIKRKLHDNIKNEYCLNNNIKLIRIKYDENIEEKLHFLL